MKLSESDRDQLLALHRKFATEKEAADKAFEEMQAARKRFLAFTETQNQAWRTFTSAAWGKGLSSIDEVYDEIFPVFPGGYHYEIPGGDQ